MVTSGEHPALSKPAPLAWTAVVLAGGVLLSDSLSASPLVPTILIALSGLLYLLLRASSQIASLALALMTVALGHLLGTITLKQSAPNDLAHFANTSPQLARITAIVSDPPRPSGTDGTALTFTATPKLLNNSTPITGHLRVRIDTPKDLAPLTPGTEVELFGRLSRTRLPDNPGQTDFAFLDALSGTSATLDVNDARSIKITGSELSPLTRAQSAWHSLAKSALQRGLDKDSSHTLLLTALLLGDTDPRLAQIQDDFQATGTTHHLAVSGTHIAVVAAFVYFLLRTLLLIPFFHFLTPRVIAATTMAIVLAYGLAVTPGEPVTRSLLLAILVLTALMTGKPVSMPNLLGLCAIVMVAYSPASVFRPGFQLTFLIVFALTLPAEHAYAHLLTYRDRDFLIADNWRPDTRGAKLRRWKWRALHILTAGLVAWITATPIIAHHFGLISPWAAIASLLLEPLVYATIVTAALKTVLSALLPFAAPLLAFPTDGLASALQHSVHALAQVPLTSLGVPSLPGPFALLALAVFAAVPLLKLPRRRQTTVYLTAALACLTLPFILALARPKPAGLHMTVLSVGSAQCILLELENEKPLLIDAGISGNANLYTRTLAPFLRSRAIRSLGPILITHADADHTSAIPALLSHHPTTELLVGESLPHAPPDSPAGKSITTARALNIPVRPLKAGDTFRHGPLTIDILSPASTEGLKENDKSLVARLTYAGKTLLLPGDIEQTAQRALLENPAELKADLLILPHHGSYEPTTADFIAATSAQHLLASDDPHPSSKQRQTYREFPLTLRTSQRGALTVTITPIGTLTVQTFR